MSALPAEFVEREYNLRAAFPDHPQWFARWAADSEAARARLDGHLNLRYGSGPRQTVDLFPAAQPRGALLFIHGGYWRALDKSDLRLLRLMTKRVGVALRGQRGNGLVRCDQGPGQYMLWEIAR